MTEVSDRPAPDQASTRPTLDMLPPCPSWCEVNHARQFGPDREPLAWTLACGGGRKAWDLTHRRVGGRVRWSRGCTRTGEHVVGRGCGKSHGRFGAGQEPAERHDAAG